MRHIKLRAALCGVAVSVGLFAGLSYAGWLFVPLLSKRLSDPTQIYIIVIAVPGFLIASLIVGLCIGLIIYFSIADKSNSQ